MFLLGKSIDTCIFSSQAKLEELRLRAKNKKSFACDLKIHVSIQSTAVISNSKGLTETLQDIRTSTYQS